MTEGQTGTRNRSADARGGADRGHHDSGADPDQSATIPVTERQRDGRAGNWTDPTSKARAPRRTMRALEYFPGQRHGQDLLRRAQAEAHGSEGAETLDLPGGDFVLQVAESGGLSGEEMDTPIVPVPSRRSDFPLMNRKHRPQGGSLNPDCASTDQDSPAKAHCRDQVG